MRSYEELYWNTCRLSLKTLFNKNKRQLSTLLLHFDRRLAATI